MTNAKLLAHCKLAIYHMDAVEMELVKRKTANLRVLYSDDPFLGDLEFMLRAARKQPPARNPRRRAIRA